MLPSFRALGQRDLKRLAKTLQALLQGRTGPLDLAACRDVIAQLHGHASWSAAQARSTAAQPADRPSVCLGTLRETSSPWSWAHRPKPVLLSPAEQAYHRLVVGCAGSGRTSALLSMLQPAMAEGQGVVYVEGKGDTAMAMKFLSLAESVGRLADVQILHLQSDPIFVRGVDRWQASLPSLPWASVQTASGSVSPVPGSTVATFNPLESATESDLSGWLTPLLLEGLPEADQRGLQPFLDAFLAVMLAGRDRGLWPLDFPVLAASLKGADLRALVEDTRLPAAMRLRLHQVLPKLTSFGHGFVDWASTDTHLTRPLLERLGAFQQDAWHARVEGGQWLAADIDWEQALLQRKLVLVLLPALERMPESKDLLPKVIQDSLIWTFHRLEAEERLPQGHRATWVFDEGHTYFTEAALSVARFGRRSGVMGIWGSDASIDFRRLSPSNRAHLMANLGMKVFLKTHGLEDDEVVWPVQMPLHERLALAQDIRAQSPGEAHVFLQSRWVRVVLTHVPLCLLPEPPRWSPVVPRWRRSLVHTA
jgi:hypothetical protein